MIIILYCKLVHLTNIFFVFCKKIHEKYFVLKFYDLTAKHNAEKGLKTVLLLIHSFMKTIHQNMHRKKRQFMGYTQSYPHYPQKLGKDNPHKRAKNFLCTVEFCS